MTLLVALLAVTVGCEVRDEHAAPMPADWTVMPGAESRPLLRDDALPTAIEYVEGCDSGLRRAADDRRPLLVVFRAPWCRWSTELSRGPLADPRLVDLSRSFVCVAVDGEREAAACRRFGVDRFPTVLLLDEAGGERFRATGAAASGLADAMATLLDPSTDRSRMAAGPAAAAR